MNLTISEIVMKYPINSSKFKLNENYLDYSAIDPYQIIKGIGRLFYIINPQETTYNNHGTVPNFYRDAWPYFLFFICLENLILRFERKRTIRLNDSLTSLSHAIIHQSGKLAFRGAEIWTYIQIYKNFRIVELSWHQPITWYLAALGVDFMYYWVHRASHEVHVLWAQHQVHHSSEEFNLAVGLRQSFWKECGLILYLPLAFFIPPAHFITHQQFNLMYQFWIHTKVVKTLGPLEYIFNTPQHHRVHHGSNIYCLDKNYGGVLIIWDRIFGTFAAERAEEEIVYGLVFNQPSFNVLHLQTFYTLYVVEKLKLVPGWRHKLAAIFYGPSWEPGAPRLGRETDKIQVTTREIYDVKLPFWCNAYLLVHFCLVVYGFLDLAACYLTLNPLTVLLAVLYIIGSLTTIGMLFDNASNAPIYELLRCIILVTILEWQDIDGTRPIVIEIFFLLSALFWLLRSLQLVQTIVKPKNH